MFLALIVLLSEFNLVIFVIRILLKLIVVGFTQRFFVEILYEHEHYESEFYINIYRVLLNWILVF
ncbi:MAG: hypothetical protein BAJALOKI1v1_320022 [Promethearchaeota archaeon]|nr:MAG: hypothetical protein BAJALOKI1v1_320022 [Candidatus Lokiarchaeota archaeon]